MSASFFLIAKEGECPRAALLEEITRLAAPPLGFEPSVGAAELPGRAGGDTGRLLAKIEAAASAGATELFLFPFSPEFGLLEKEALAGLLTEARRRTGIPIHHDELRLDHPLVVQAYSDVALKALNGRAERARLVLAAAGEGDPSTRAQAYALMRLIWEQAGFAAGETGFLRHANPFVRAVLERAPQDGFEQVVVPLVFTGGERLEYLRLIVEDHRRVEAANAVVLAEPPGGHPAIAAWAAQRILSLWREKREREAKRSPSPRRAERAPAVRLGTSTSTGLAAEIRDSVELRHLLPDEIRQAPRVFVKVTWHGYATGTYTSPASLDALLGALEGRAVIVEGHTSSRNDGSANFDWETEAEANRTWIREQEAEYLRRTGLATVLARHGAQYLNVTEAFWDGACLPRHEVLSHLREAGIALRHEDLAAFVPQAIAESASAPLISFAGFKGPTRLSVSNLFGLIPAPLRSAWHGPDIRFMAHVCCEIAKLYGAFLPVYGLVEGIFSAVRWDRQGLYRSRWGNYDLRANPGLATFSRGFGAADALAARLQGQDIAKSAFFSVVREELGIPEEAETLELPLDWLQRLA